MAAGSAKDFHDRSKLGQVSSLELANTGQNFKAGNTGKYYTSDPWVLKMIAEVEIKFHERPSQTRIPFPYRFSGEELGLMETEMRTLTGNVLFRSSNNSRENNNSLTILKTQARWEM